MKLRHQSQGKRKHRTHWRLPENFGYNNKTTSKSTGTQKYTALWRVPEIVLRSEKTSNGVLFFFKNPVWALFGKNLNGKKCSFPWEMGKKK